MKNTRLSEGKLYLFDLQLGLPIPGKDAAQVATLAEVVADPELLRKLDLGDEYQYPLTAEVLLEVEAQLITTPLQLSRRAKLLQESIEGTDAVREVRDLAQHFEHHMQSCRLFLSEIDSGVFTNSQPLQEAITFD